MAPGRFSGLSRSKRTIKGSAGGGGKAGNISGKAPGAGNIVGPTSPTSPTSPTIPTGPVKPDFTKNPLAPWDSNTPIGQLFNQGLVKFPTQNKAVTGLDPRVKMVAGDSTRERVETVNRILAAQRPATSPMDPRIKATGVVGDSGRERVSTYNRIASGRSVFQRQNQIARMGGTQRGSAIAKAASAGLRAGAAASRAAAAAPAAKAAPKATPKAVAGKPAGVAKTAPAAVKKATVVKKKTTMVAK